MPSKKNLLLQLLNICLSGILAFLVFDFFASTLKEKNKSFIKYNIPSDDKNALFSGQKVTDAINKHFLLQTFTLTGNDKKDEKILFEFNNAVRRNSELKKPINIIRLNLGNNVTYGRFISILNLMKKEDYKRYFEWEKYFYVITKNIRIPGYDMSPPRLLSRKLIDMKTFITAIVFLVGTLTGFAQANDPFIVFPIELKFFQAEKTSQHNVLRWLAPCTSDFVVFEVQHSTDSKNFTVLHSFTADQIRCARPFDYTDLQCREGTNCYRIKLTTPANTSVNSFIVAVQNGKKSLN